jgi:hypothetical protein
MLKTNSYSVGQKIRKCMKHRLRYCSQEHATGSFNEPDYSSPLSYTLHLELLSVLKN